MKTFSKNVPAVMLVSLLGFAIIGFAAKSFAAGSDSDTDPHAAVLQDLEIQLQNEELDPEARALLEAKRASLLSDLSTRTAAPRPTKSGKTSVGTVVAPTIAPFEPFIGEVRNSPYHDNYATGNNQWEGWIDRHPTSVVAGNLVTEPDQAILTVWVRAVGDEAGQSYEIKLPRPTGTLVITGFTDDSILSESADGSKWRLNVARRELTEE